MEILRWNERFSVGNQEIDRQHKALFDLINNLLTHSGKTHKRHEVAGIIEELIAYTDYHFTSEEALLKDHPAFATHHDIHTQFIEMARFFEKSFKEGKENITGDLFTYLVKWTREHILETDITAFQEMAPNKSSTK